MKYEGEIKITCGDKELIIDQSDIRFEAASNYAIQSLFSGDRTNIELDYSDTPAAYFTILTKMGLSSKYSPYTLNLMRKGCKSVHVSNNWLKMHHIPMMRRLSNERGRRSHLGEE